MPTVYTVQDIKNKIESALARESHVRIYFKNTERLPIWGTFVSLNDHEELWKKGYVRVLKESQYDKYKETKNPIWTRVFMISEINDVLLY